MTLVIDEGRVLDEETRSRNEQSLLRLQKLQNLALLSGSIAHDFNNMIGSILGNVSFVLRELPSGSPGRDAATDIETAARRAAELTRRLLAYSGRGRSAVETVDLNRLVEETAALVRKAIPVTTVLRLTLDEYLPSIDVDAAQARQMILNLLTNAYHSLPERAGVVTLTTGSMDVAAASAELDFNRKIEVGAYIYLEVADTGCGMTREALDRILEPAPASRETGHGLGLAATLGIVHGYRGAIRASSQPGEGTTVTIVLPVGRRSRPSGELRISSPG
jgi:two-component system, cell cycle sensor histidine kinase and response regulator CckA